MKFYTLSIQDNLVYCVFVWQSKDILRTGSTRKKFNYWQRKDRIKNYQVGSIDNFCLERFVVTHQVDYQTGMTVGLDDDCHECAPQYVDKLPS
jgi:hypothetical protein